VQDTDCVASGSDAAQRPSQNGPIRSIFQLKPADRSIPGSISEPPSSPTGRVRRASLLRHAEELALTYRMLGTEGAPYRRIGRLRAGQHFGERACWYVLMPGRCIHTFPHPDSCHLGESSADQETVKAQDCLSGSSTVPLASQGKCTHVQDRRTAVSFGCHDHQLRALQPGAIHIIAARYSLARAEARTEVHWCAHTKQACASSCPVLTSGKQSPAVAVQN
jgi:hypothetical protein